MTAAFLCLGQEARITAIDGIADGHVEPGCRVTAVAGVVALQILLELHALTEVPVVAIVVSGGAL